MKFRLLFIIVSVILLLWVSAASALAQEELPPSYAGLENPFSWDDPSVQEAGKGVYQLSCLGCHGIRGDNLAVTDFSRADYPQSLEARPGFYFWVMSEGRLDKGMPPYKSSLSEDQRWQVLTYLWSLGATVPPEVIPSLVEVSGEVAKGTLLLTAPEQAPSGQLLTLSTLLKDNQGKPVQSATVKFFVKVSFFGNSLMEVGETVTDSQGIAKFEYTPRRTGYTRIIARYGDSEFSTIETDTVINLTESDGPLYQAEAGIRLPAPGTEVFIGPKSALELEEGGKAPASAFRLPGGILSWLLLLVGTVVLIWFTYFRVMYQVFRIPVVSEITDTNTRLVPLVGLVMVVVFGIFLALMLLTGPYSHLHLLR